MKEAPKVEILTYFSGLGKRRSITFEARIGGKVIARVNGIGVSQIVIRKTLDKQVEAWMAANLEEKKDA